MAKVVAKDYDSPEAMLKAFKRKVMNEGIIQDYRAHEFYESPGQKKRRKRLASERKFYLKKVMYNGRYGK